MIDWAKKLEKTESKDKLNAPLGLKLHSFSIEKFMFLGLESQSH